MGTLERGGRWCRRNPVIAALAGLAIIGLSTGLVGLSIGYLRVSRALDDTRRLALAEEEPAPGAAAVDDLFTKVSEDTLLNQPGMQPVRMDLLRRARNYYEKFLVQSEGSQSVRDELALAHFRVGLITEEIDSPAKAIPSYETARRAQTELLSIAPHNVGRLKALGDTLNAIGRCWHKQQRLEQALEAYATAIDTRKRLVAAAQTSATFNGLWPTRT